MLNFTFYSPTKFVFGKGEENNIGQLLSQRGAKKVLLHYGGQSAEKSGLLGRVRTSLKGAGIEFVELGGVHPNPRFESRAYHDAARLPDSLRRHGYVHPPDRALLYQHKRCKHHR